MNIDFVPDVFADRFPAVMFAETARVDNVPSCVIASCVAVLKLPYNLDTAIMFPAYKFPDVTRFAAVTFPAAVKYGKLDT